MDKIGLIRHCVRAWITLVALFILPIEAADAGEMRPDEIVRHYGKAVALITGVTSDGDVSQGSGFIVSSNGLVITNRHVVQNTVQAHVRLMSGRSYAVQRIVSANRSKDLVVLKINGTGFPTVRLGDSSNLSIGARLYVIGSPRGLENSITDGLLSGRRHLGTHQLLQISAPISSGSSGSPVFDGRGRVVGVAVATVQGGQNLNLAVPVRYVRDLVAKAMNRHQDVGSGHQSGGQGATRKPRSRQPAIARRSPARVRGTIPGIKEKDGKRSSPGTRILTETRLLEGHEGAVEWVKWSPDGTRLVSYGRGSIVELGKVRWWEAETGEELSLPFSHDWVWSPDWRRVAWGSDRQLMIQDALRAQEPIAHTGGEGRAIGIAWSPDSRRVAVTYPDVVSKNGTGGAVWIWDTITGAVIKLLRGQPVGSEIAWSPDGLRLALSCWDRTVRVFDTTTWAPVSLRSRGEYRTRLEWCPDGRHLAASGFSGQDEGIEVWEVGARQKVADLKGSQFDWEWDPKGRYLAWLTPCRDAENNDWGRVFIWDASTRRERQVSALGKDNILLAWSPEGRWLAAGNLRIKLWNLQTGATLATGSYRAWPNDMVWSPKGKSFAAACSDGTVRMWDLPHGW